MDNIKQRQLVGLLTEQLAQQISNPTILSYKPSSNGVLTGKVSSLGRVFNFMVQGNTVSVKPSAGRTDSALFSRLYLEANDRLDATRSAKQLNPNCGAKSYRCKGDKGVGCIPVTNHCRRTETDAISKERLLKIRSLTKELAASGGDTTKLSAAEASIKSGRQALADKNRSERTPKKVEPKVETAKVETAKAKKPLNQKLVDKYVDHLKNVGGLPFSKQNSPEAKEAQRLFSDGIKPNTLGGMFKAAERELADTSKPSKKLKNQMRDGTQWDKEVRSGSGLKHAWELTRAELDGQFKDLERKYKDNPEKLTELTKIYKRLRKASYMDKPNAHV